MKSPAVQFNGTNFKVWLARFSGHVADKGLQENLRVERPAEEGEPQALWDAREEKLRGKLTEWLDDDHLKRTMNFATTKEAVAFLEGRAAQRTGQGKGMLRAQFSALQMAKDQQVKSWISAVLDKAEDMAAAGIALGEGEVKDKLLSGLPQAWATTKKIILGRADYDALSEAEIIDLLLAEHESLEAQGDTKDRANQLAMAALKLDNDNDNDVNEQEIHPKFRGNCHNCGKKGHRMADCWAPGGGKEKHKTKQGSATQAALARWCMVATSTGYSVSRPPEIQADEAQG